MMRTIKKKRIREAAVTVLPWVYCTLMFSPVIAAVTSIACGVESIGPLLWSLALVVPFGALFLAADRLKYLWQYILAAAAVIAAVFMVSRNWAAVACLAVVALAKLAARSREEPTVTVFDEPHVAFGAIYPVAFFYSGVMKDEFLQIASVILCVVFIVVNFMYRGLERLNRYIAINEDMADFPAKRIGKSGTALFFAGSVFFLAIVIPLLAAYFPFVPFYIKSSTGPSGLSVTHTETIEKPAAGKADWMQAIDEEMGEPSPVLAFLGKVVMAAAVVLSVALVVYGIYKLSRNFRRTVAEKNDVIEYSRDFAEPVPARVKAEKLRRFDVSPTAYVRKKYIKAVKKSKKDVPEKWYSPAEIECFAGVEDAALHRLYEKARYSSGGCTEEDKAAVQRSGRD